MTEHTPAETPPVPPPVAGAKQWVEDILPYFELVSNVAIVFLALGFMLSLFGYLNSRRNDKSSVFLALRNDYSQILEILQRNVPDYDSSRPLTGYPSLPADAKKALRKYWVHSLNEYIISNVLHEKDSLGLWKNFYARAQSSALDMPLLRAALEDLIRDTTYSFGGHKEDYISELKKAYKAHRKKPVRLPEVREGVAELEPAQGSDDAAELTRDILRKLRLRGKDGPISEDLQMLIDEAERLRSADESPAYQAECLAACLALEAAAQGDFGVGAVLADPDGRVLGMARNTVFSSGDTSRHAEMNIISGHHIGPTVHAEQDAALRQITLISSLEPCPMCLSRISMTPLQRIVYLAPDPGGGMVEHKAHLPEVWRGFLDGKQFERSEHASLGAFAWKVFERTKEKDAQLQH